MRIVYFIILFTFVCNYAKNQGLTNSLNNLSHENLLDNPWFTVNQRGQSSYTELNKYTVDRWRTEGNSADFSVDIVSDGVQLKRNVSEGYFTLCQFNESSFLIPGKEYTLSILYSDGTVKFKTFVVPIYEQSYLRIAFTQNYMGCQAIIDRKSSGYYSTFIIHDGDFSISPIIKALKVELGSVSTLAMDTAPNYQQELAKCQRYFYRYKAAHTGFYFGLAIAWNTNKMSMVLPVPCMRSTVTITPSDFSDFLASKGASNVSPHNITNFENLGQSEQNHASGLLITTSESDLTSGDIYVLKAVNSSAYIDFSADL